MSKSTFAINTTLYDVDVRLDKDEVLDAFDNDELLKHIKDNCSVDDLMLGFFVGADEALDYLCSDIGNLEVAKHALNGVDGDDLSNFIKELGHEPQLPPVIEFALVDEIKAPHTFWVKADGVTRCIVTHATVVTKYGTMSTASITDAHNAAAVLAVGMAMEERLVKAS